jgi:uncharacterized protein YkwD
MLNHRKMNAPDRGRMPVIKAIWAAIVLLTLSAAVFAAAPPAAHAGAASNEQVLLRLINTERARHGLAKLRLQSSLDTAARAHSGEMLRRGYFSHSSASGASCSTRILRAGYVRSGFGSWAVSEAIGWGKGARGTPQVVLRAWLASPWHRPIILGARWRDVGVGCARGTYAGRTGVVMYTVDVGRRTR